MKLTQDKIDDIYCHIGIYGASQRYTAYMVGVSRGAVSRYLQPKEIARRYNEINIKRIKAENEISLYRNLAIVGFLGFIVQASINFLI